jgi:hypothetical protein
MNEGEKVATRDISTKKMLKYYKKYVMMGEVLLPSFHVR